MEKHVVFGEKRKKFWVTSTKLDENSKETIFHTKADNFLKNFWNIKSIEKSLKASERKKALDDEKTQNNQAKDSDIAYQDFANSDREERHLHDLDELDDLYSQIFTIQVIFFLASHLNSLKTLIES